MSKIPKTSQATLSASAQADVERRARAAAEEAERARRAREEEQRRRQTEAARRTLEGSLADLRQELARLRTAAEARFVEAELAVHEREREQLEREAPRAQDLTALATLGARAARARGALTETRARAQATERAERARRELERQRAEAQAALDVVETALTAMEGGLGRKFDPLGRAELEGQLEQARAALTRGDLSASRAISERARQRLEEHRHAVVERHAAWEAARERARVARAAVDVRLAGLEADGLVLHWRRTDLQALLEKHAVLQTLEAGEHWDALAREAATLEARAEAVLIEARARHEQEVRRAYLIEAFLRTLPIQGFRVGEPQLLGAGDADEDVVIYAERQDGRRLDVTLPVQGPVRYRVDEGELRVEASPEGHPVSTCDEAERRLTVIHAHLREELGVEMSDLRWDDMPPDRLRRGAKELPSSGPAQTRTAGGHA